MANEIRSFAVPYPPTTGDSSLDGWMRGVSESINNLPFSIFSTADGPNNSLVTSPEGFIGIEVGSASTLTKFWFKESGSTSTGWTPLNKDMTDYDLKVSAGAISGVSGVNKFGRNPVIDTTTDPEDVWDAGGLHAGAVSAQTFAILSDDTEDDAGGSGTSQVEVYGLQDWDTSETMETVTVNGTTATYTANSYVFIHRMKAVSGSPGAANVGTIQAVYGVGDTVMAQISPTEGQTLMALYAVSSLDKFHITKWYMAANKSGAAGSASVQLNVIPSASGTSTQQQVKHHLGLQTAGSSIAEHEFKPYFKVSGPALIKVEVLEVSQNGFDISAGFDGYLVKNTTAL